MTDLRSLTQHDRRRFLHTATFATAAAWLTGVRSRAETLPEAEITSLRKFMAEELATPPYPIPGVVVMVGTLEEILFHEAVGLAQVTPREIPMRPDTIFDIASVTKVVAAATACGLCVDRGLLDPDAPMSRYLPDHQGTGIDKITLRHLAAHTSGFAANPRLYSWGKGEAFFQGMLAESPSWPVGTRYEYADRNTILLGVIVERVTGLPFGEFCTQEIFQPLGMKDSTFNATPHLDRVAGTHIEAGISHNTDSLAAGRAIGAVGLFTTAPDLARFCRMLLREGLHENKRFLSAEVIRDFTRDFTQSQDLEAGFSSRGFIWATGEEPYRPERLSASAYGHGGWTGTALWIDPEKELFALMLGNRIHPKVLGGNSRIPQYKKLARIADRILTALDR
ncbi:MAG: beta-lactamase family protein [Verrucomicrobiaceae bacterium]|nr:beta-lactamase family protein [Verrucomicrobiaceae bacterium]